MSEKLFKEIVRVVIKKELRDEAFQILMIGSQNRGDWEKELKDVVDNYFDGTSNENEKSDNTSSFNIVCMALDFAKYKLVKAGLMEQKPTDGFGDMDFMLNDGD